MINKPFIIIPGQQKCGSTTLFEILNQHNSIRSLNHKASNFLILKNKKIEENIDWFRKLFSENDARYILHSSVIYFSFQRPIENIDKYIKNPKIIIILRDPVKRAYSAFWHMKKRVPTKEKRTFKTICKKINDTNLNDIIESEDQLLQEAIKKGEIDRKQIYDSITIYNPKIKPCFEDSLVEYRYFRNSIYSKEIQKWYQSDMDIKIIYFEELINTPRRVIKNLFEFLELPISKSDLELPHANKTKVPNNILSKIYKLTTKNLMKNINFPKFGKGFLEKRYKKINRLLFASKPNLSKESYLIAKKKLYDEYEYWYSKNERLEDLWRF